MSTDLLLQIGVAASTNAAVQEFIRLNAELEAIKRTLSTLTGGDDQATKALEHLAELANRTGQNTLNLSHQFASLTAAAKGTALEGEGLRDVFDTVSAAMGMIGADSERTGRAFTALAQMMAKGQVYAEEWRGQLAEALPLANEAVQKATGLTVQEFNQLIESGQAISADIIPAMVHGLKLLGVDSTRQVDTLGASMERLRNATQSAFTAIGQRTGAEGAMTATLDGLTTAVKSATEGFILLENAAGTTASAGVQTFQGLLPAVGDELRSMGTQLRAVSQLLASGGQDFDRFWSEIKQSVQEAGAPFERAKIGLQTYLDVMGELIDTGVRNVFGEQQHQAALSATHDALIKLSEQSTKQASDYASLRGAAVASAEATRKLGEASVEAARVAESVATITGRETDALLAKVAALEAASAAARNNAEAAQRLASLDANRLRDMERDLISLEQEKELNAAAAEQIDIKASALQALIDKQREVATNSAAAAAGLQSEAQLQEVAAQKAQLAAQTYGDQSARIGEFRAALDGIHSAMQLVATSQDGLTTRTVGYRTEVDGLHDSVLRLQSAEIAGARAAQMLIDVRARLIELETQRAAITDKSAPAYADLADKIASLRAQESQLTTTVTAGKAASQQLLKARSDESVMTARLADAQNDARRSLENETTTRQLALRSLIAEARAKGDASSAARLEAQLADETATALRALLVQQEADLAITEKRTAAKIAEVEASGKAAEQIDAEKNLLEANVQQKREQVVQTKESIAALATQAAATKQADKETQNLNRNVEQTTDAVDTYDAAQQRAEASTAAFAESLAGAQAAARWMSDMLDEAKQSIAGYSQEAAAAVDSLLSGVNSLEENIHNLDKLDAARFVNIDSLTKSRSALGELEAALKATTDKAEKFLEASTAPFHVFGGMDIQLAAVYRFEARLLAAQASAQRLAISAEELDGKLGTLQKQFDQGDLSLADYINKLKLLESNYARLGDERLEGLRQALADAKRQMDDFANSAKDGLQSLQVEWAQLNDQQGEVLRLEYLQQQMKIQQELADAQAAGNSAAINSLEQQLALLDRIYRKKQENLKADEQSAKANAADGQSSSTSTATAGIAKTIRLVLDTPQGGQPAAVTASDEQAANQLISVLKRAGLRAL